ncbi:MAG: histidine kinase dimerization/phospho-acceptor domain-containing protein, partial [Vicinamibacterales bacterium]
MPVSVDKTDEAVANAAGLVGPCRALLSADTVDDLLAIAPRLVRDHLAVPVACQIVLVDPVGPTPGDLEIGALDQVCVPLRHENRLVGAIVVDAGQSGLERDDESERWLIAFADLLATAIVTRQRAASEQQRLLAEAAGLKLDIVSMLSHEMRTPLASIKGYASALLLDDVEWDSAERT